MEDSSSIFDSIEADLLSPNMPTLEDCMGPHCFSSDWGAKISGEWYFFFGHECDRCDSVGQITHSNDHFITTLTFHGYFGTLRHAILVIQEMMNPAYEQKWITDISSMDAESVDKFISNYRNNRILDGYRLLYNNFPALRQVPLSPVKPNFTNAVTELPSDLTWQAPSNPAIQNFTYGVSELAPRLFCNQAGAEFIYDLQADTARYEPMDYEVLFRNANNAANIPDQIRNWQETYGNNPLVDDYGFMYDNCPFLWNAPSNPVIQNLAYYHAGAKYMDALHNNNEWHAPIANEAPVLGTNNVANLSDAIKNWQETYITRGSSSAKGHLGKKKGGRRRAPCFTHSEQRRRSKEMTYNDVSPYFHLPARDAARKLHMSAPTLKKIRTRLHLEIWPYRKVASDAKWGMYWRTKNGTVEKTPENPLGKKML